MKIHELKYSNTNTYLIEGENGILLIDTGWAGTFKAFCSCMGGLGIPVQSIDYILITHFHPDHCGIAQNIVDLGPVIAVMDVQKNHIHDSDHIFEKENNREFAPIKDKSVRYVSVHNSRIFLSELGIAGQIIHTPGHSDDSVSVLLDDGSLFVGDLNPLYELELHRGTEIGKSWDMLLSQDPSTIYYGHAAATNLKEAHLDNTYDEDLYALTSRIMKYIDKGMTLDRICKKTGADEVFVEDVTRMYLTHRDVGVQGILDRIEIKGK